MEIPYEVTARRDTGLWNAKIGIWLFLASEVMLFGGLFSGYVFLRIGVIEGVDNPWPTHVQSVIPGFINTLVLIASSVFVVFSWVALKERSWKRFQIWMSLVVACALVFLCIKAYEYNKKFSHYGIQLQDGSLLEAEIQKDTDRIRFEANEVSVDLNRGSMVFLGMVDGELPRFQVPVDAYGIVRGGYESYDELPESVRNKYFPEWFRPNSEEGDSEEPRTVDLEKWIDQACDIFAAVQKEKRARIKEVDYQNAKVELKMAEAKDKGEEYTGPGLLDYDSDDDDDAENGNYWKGIMDPQTSKITLKVAMVEEKDEDSGEVKLVEDTFSLNARHSKVSGRRAATAERDGQQVDVINFVDSSQVGGTLIDDSVHVYAMDIHDIDLQRIRTREGQQSAMVWEFLEQDPHMVEVKIKEQFFAHQEARLELLDEHYGKREAVPARQLHSREANVFHIKHGAHEEEHGAADDHGHGDSEHHGDESHAKPETGGAAEDGDDPTAKAGGEDHSKGTLIKIPRDQIARVSNHGPQYGTYYAIYFTMTGLHGLHVIGGAIVLTYFLLFGKKLFLKNPEHMANRVEVGGLFWHFVDLVWIFLFPIMYLL